MEPLKKSHARHKAWTPDKVRERIRASMILRRLTNHVLGHVEMTTSQVNAAKILLGKVIPDMRQLEHTGTVNHVNYDAAVLAVLNAPGDARGAEQVTH